jgi:hypothetical protein
MSPESYKKVMALLDIVKHELNVIAAATGHVDFTTFIAQDQPILVTV